MKYLVIALFVLSCAVYAKQRTELTKVVKVESTITATPDSAKIAWDDTLKITTVYRDTEIVVSVDTLRPISHSATRIVPKVVAKK
jgi:hypothetical protein